MKYEGVIFDFNGTLFFDNDKHVGAWGQISQELRGRGITQEELFTHMNGVPNEKIIEYLSEGACVNKQEYSQKKEMIYRRLCKEDKEHFHLVSGAERLFDTLKDAGIPFTIASASIRENIDFFVEEFHLDRWMDPERIIYDDGTYDSKKQMFTDAASAIGSRPENTLVYEDSFSGIRSAWDAGINSIIAVCEKEKKEEYAHLPGVIRTIETFDELIAK